MNIMEVFGNMDSPILGALQLVLRFLAGKFVKPWYDGQHTYAKYLITDEAQALYDGLLLLREKTTDEEKKKTIEQIIELIRSVFEAAEFGVNFRGIEFGS